MTPNGFRMRYTRRLWEQFTQGTPITTEGLPDHVYRSWLACQAKGLSPEGIPEPMRLNAEELEAIREEYREIIEIAKPVLNMILLSTSETDPIVILTSATGVILHVTGDESSVSVQEKFYNTPGVVCDESLLDARATTLTMKENKPLSLCGSEHYFEIFHESLCYAAPICDHTQHIVGSISIASSLKQYHPHTMAMLSAAAENISMQLAKKVEDNRKKYLSSLIYSICNTIPDGIVALDMNNHVTYVNRYAEEIFSHTEKDMLGKPISDFIHSSSLHDLLQALAVRKQRNVSIQAKNTSLDKKYLCRVQPFTDNAKTVGATLFLASDEQILKGLSHVGGNRAHYRFEDILGNSPQIRSCIQLAKRVAKKATRILLTGESGTGKELFAQAIHNAGPRQGRPFVAISCASIPRELVEAELFGYVGGAFTGASKSGAVGKFELAQNGTLFLDEINSLPLEAQGKLLRALQQNEIIRVGGKAPIAVNVHIIAATNANLSDLVAAHMFRDDLLYRINSVEIHIPPLRERTQDVEILIKHFINYYAKLQNRTVTISPQWLHYMVQHQWLGNVRELENACEYAMIVCEDDTLLPKHLPTNIGVQEEQHEKDLLHCVHVDDAYKQWLVEIMAACGGNITQAAEKFGLSRSTLYRKLKKYDLVRDAFRNR